MSGLTEDVSTVAGIRLTRDAHEFTGEFVRHWPLTCANSDAHGRYTGHTTRMEQLARGFLLRELYG